jgi:hypothetical protein
LFLLCFIVMFSTAVHCAVPLTSLCYPSFHILLLSLLPLSSLSNLHTLPPPSLLHFHSLHPPTTRPFPPPFNASIPSLLPLSISPPPSQRLAAIANGTLVEPDDEEEEEEEEKEEETVKPIPIPLSLSALAHTHALAPSVSVHVTGSEPEPISDREPIPELGSEVVLNSSDGGVVVQSGSVEDGENEREIERKRERDRKEREGEEKEKKERERDERRRESEIEIEIERERERAAAALGETSNTQWLILHFKCVD